MYFRNRLLQTIEYFFSVITVHPETKMIEAGVLLPRIEGVNAEESAFET